MARKFAQGTTVSIEKSQAEIQKLVKKYGATHFGVMTDPAQSMIAFCIRKLNVRFTVPVVQLGDMRDGHGAHIGGHRAIKAAEQEQRRLWRALTMSIKAKLEMTESGLSCFEEEFLAHVVTPTGRTIGEEMIPQLEDLQSGRTLPLLPAPKDDR